MVFGFTKFDKASARRRRLAAAPCITSGRSALRINSAARSSAPLSATGSAIGWGGTVGIAGVSSAAMSSGRSFLLRHSEGLSHDRWDCRRADDRMCHLGQPRHSRDDVHDLKAGLLAAQNAFLPCYHDHGHRIELGISGARRQIERARTKRRKADASRAGEATMCRRHESRRLFAAYSVFPFDQAYACSAGALCLVCRIGAREDDRPLVEPAHRFDYALVERATPGTDADQNCGLQRLDGLDEIL